jgi:hypothetical protein
VIYFPVDSAAIAQLLSRPQRRRGDPAAPVGKGLALVWKLSMQLEPTFPGKEKHDPKN